MRSQWSWCVIVVITACGKPREGPLVAPKNTGDSLLTTGVEVAMSTSDFAKDREEFLGLLRKMKDDHFKAEQKHNRAFFGLTIMGAASGATAPLTRSDTPKVLAATAGLLTFMVGLIRPDNRATKHNRCVQALSAEIAQFVGAWGAINPPQGELAKDYVAAKQDAAKRLVASECVR